GVTLESNSHRKWCTHAHQRARALGLGEQVYPSHHCRQIFSPTRMREEIPGCGVGIRRASKVARDDVAGVARCYQPTLRNQEAAIAKGFYGGHFVADEKYRSAAGAHVAHFPETFLLKAGVPNGEHLVNQLDL